ncbi:MAG: YdiU family protein [Burkholderiaceae bacterium]|nr:YdiU family protein [Burkholderiaceae bacterium]
MNSTDNTPTLARLPTLAHGPDWTWRNRFRALGCEYHTELQPQPMHESHWIAHSDACAALLGLPAEWQMDPRWNALEVFSGNALWPGMQPLASVYSGHQFGVWAGQLGDGRALWLGEIDTTSGPMELQLKGSGLTPYSRMGDGRAVLRSSIREFLCSEAMHGLGIPTTHALCITGSSLPVRREALETAAVVTRVAPSFIRFGHFEHFSQHDEPDSLKRLADFVIEHHYPECLNTPQPYIAMLGTVARRTAELLAQWQAVGFCHGVMNTDNMSILGLTLDYGPFGFLDSYDPGHVCNHTDHKGRYAFSRQPSVAFWNLHALAQALMPLIGNSHAALDAIDIYKPFYADAMRRQLRNKLGFTTTEAGDAGLIDWLLKQMAYEKTDHTILFRRLSRFSSAEGTDNSEVLGLFKDRKFIETWSKAYGDRLRSEGSNDAQRAAAMNRVNPSVVLRNHLAEAAIRQAQGGDFSEVQRLLKVLQNPFDESIDGTDDADFPPDWAQEIEVSCSS